MPISILSVRRGILSSYLDQLRDLIRSEEGFKSKAYLDTVGVLTIGTGINVEENFSRTGTRLAEKVGDEASSEILDKAELSAINIAVVDARSFLSNFDGLNLVRRLAVSRMSFNLGGPRLRTFKNFKAAMEVEDFGKAADEIMNSRMALQVPNRSKRLAATIHWGV